MKFSRALSGLAVTLALVLTVSGATLTPVPAQAGTEDAAIYYDELSQHGNWVEYENYGPVWYPTQVDQDWRPYTNGRWTPSEQGYLFETQEPWGWATYHYGNWMPTQQYGWCWVPGRTWYPNTVAWRNSPETAPVDTSYVGWAPIPPPNYVPPPNTGWYPQNYQPGMGPLDLLTAPFWIFSQASRFLLGFGQPYNQGYSYNNCGCLAPPTYYRVIYPVTRIIPSWYYPNYYPTGYFAPGAMGAYGWGPSTRYISRVTNINHVTINNYITRTPVNNIHNSLPPNHWRDRHHHVYDKIVPPRDLLVKNKPMQVTNVNMAVRNLNRPNVVVQPAGLKPLDVARIPKATPVTQVQPGAPLKGMGLSNKAAQQVTPQMTERIHKAKPLPGMQPLTGIQPGQPPTTGVAPGAPGVKAGPGPKLVQPGQVQPGQVQPGPKGPGEGPGIRRGPVTREPGEPVRRGPVEGQPGVRKGPGPQPTGPGPAPQVQQQQQLKQQEQLKLQQQQQLKQQEQFKLQQQQQLRQQEQQKQLQLKQQQLQQQQQMKQQEQMKQQQLKQQQMQQMKQQEQFKQQQLQQQKLQQQQIKQQEQMKQQQLKQQQMQQQKMMQQQQMQQQKAQQQQQQHLQQQQRKKKEPPEPTQQQQLR